MSSKRDQAKKVKGIDSEEGRRRREATAVAIRKDKKEESLLKRRNISSHIENDDVTPTENNTPSETTSMAEKDTANKRVYALSDMPELLLGLKSNDPKLQISSMRGFRKLLSVEKDAPVQQCIDCGAISLFVSSLTRSDSPELQFEAAWALTNVASTNYTEIVVEYGSIPYLCQLLTCGVGEIREQAAWCLGNVAGDCTTFRDLILSHQAMGAVVANIMQPATVSLLRNCTWTLSNFCRGKPQPTLNSIMAALPALKHLVMNPSTDQETLVDAIWALSYICDGDDDRIAVVTGLGVIPALVNILKSNQYNIIVPALRTLGNIVSGNDSQTQIVIQAGVLPILTPLLGHPKKNIRKEALWMLSNIAAGSAQQLAALMATPGLINMVLDQMSVNVEWDIRKEATWVICNVTSSGCTAHIMSIVEKGVIGQLLSLLDISDVKMLLNSMDAIEMILRVGQMNERLNYCAIFDELEGIDKLEGLQEHEHEGVYKKAVHLLETYFGGEEESESENCKPVANANTFSFGIANSTGLEKSVFNFQSASGIGPSQQSTTQFSFGF